MKHFCKLAMLLVGLTGTAAAQQIALLDVESGTKVTEEIVKPVPRKDGAIGDCEGDPGGADFWAKAAGKAGVPIIGDALIIMKVRNHDRNAKPLGAREREALR